jgi:L-threonylcarbamoyladenylate synthase
MPHIHNFFIAINFLFFHETGAVFIHPTDTIYGIGCNARLSDSVKRLREIKNQMDRPLSVIAPSKEWVRRNCDSPNKVEMRRWLKKLPGPYTLILKLKNKRAICPETNLNSGTIGIRLPDHWMTDVAKSLDIPIVTTSANISGRDYMTNLDDLEKPVADKVDFIIYEGEKPGHASTIINLSGEEVMVRKR